jgi:hypothetical protein
MRNWLGSRDGKAGSPSFAGNVIQRGRRVEPQCDFHGRPLS